MVVHVIDQLGIWPDKTEGDAPVAVDPHSPIAFQITAQRMRPVTRMIHFLRFRRRIQSRQNTLQFGSMRCLHTTARPCFVQEFETLVPEADYHDADVARIASRYKKVLPRSVLDT
jgi:hypothetical protein